jgi:phosphohistidine phosphatase
MGIGSPEIPSIFSIRDSVFDIRSATMKTLYLVRHAKSSWDKPGLADADRPLNERGKRDAPEMGRRLAARGVDPDALLSSPAKRARSTARRIAEAMDRPKDSVRCDERLYVFSDAPLLEFVRALDEALQRPMLFGHNPAMTDLANRLGDTTIDNIPTCGVVCLALNVDSWNNVASGCGHCEFFDTPK